MDSVAAWLPEMTLLLNTIESPDTTVSFAVHTESALLELQMYAPTTNEMEPP
jgi:hypothetical protein